MNKTSNKSMTPFMLIQTHTLSLLYVTCFLWVHTYLWMIQKDLRGIFLNDDLWLPLRKTKENSFREGWSKGMLKFTVILLFLILKLYVAYIIEEIILYLEWKNELIHWRLGLNFLSGWLNHGG